ncbi:MAG: ATP-binding cassette domain-containing protein [Acidovorax sp.]|jgi:lipopolysaccharide transport system ATP-binding protein|nr:ATP-binding cassette domain-containing protein [Xylophilus sp.]MBP7420038.1 ATP-binding cassette domain-containing protein [Burkholderiaceae bacterium]MBP7544247.1 ATP-binding cassette domain-containing protein [Acidovorax sp.]MBP7967932.1 ATP-binding cassette domain-containing protein [Brachymonas sp.]
MSSEAQTTHWAIRAQGVGKTYRLYDKPHHRLLQSLWRGRKSYYREFAALHNISFELERGQTLGIIGRNGAGKSTLLQIICGTLHPSAGNVQVRGRIAALLELGTGFNPEFTGRENIAINAAILGLSQREISERLDDIIAFADIGTFIDQPVKTYSSGMYVRLAFAVVVHVNPDILIVDEALAVGDALFQAKCMTRMRRMLDDGLTLLFISHDISAVKALCQRTLWIDHGQVRAMGPTAEVTRDYDHDWIRQANAAQALQPITPLTLTAEPESDELLQEEVVGTGAVALLAHGWGANGMFGAEARAQYGDTLQMHLRLQVRRPCQHLVVSYHIKNRQNQHILGGHSADRPEVHGRTWQAGEVFELTFEIPVHLHHGDYALTVLAASIADVEHYTDAIFHLWADDIATLHITPRARFPLSDQIEPPQILHVTQQAPWLVLDDFFPNLLTGFRVAEYNAHLAAFPQLSVLSSLGDFAAQHERYAQCYPMHASRVRPYASSWLAGAGLVYMNFLNNAHQYLPALQQHHIPFVLTLYPGGGFGLDEPESDAKLAAVLASPLLQAIIVTQPVTQDYLQRFSSRRGLALPPLHRIDGVVVNPLYFEADGPARAPAFGHGKATLDICFVAECYMPLGANKGYPEFIAAARALADLPELRWHIVGGGYTADELDITALGQRIQFHGRLDTPDLRQFYAGMDLIISPNQPFLLHPGNFDGFPTGCCVEASLCGVAVMATDALGQNPGYVDADTMLLLETSANTALAPQIEARVRQLYADPTALKRIGQAGQTLTRQLYAPERQIGQRQHILRTVANQLGLPVTKAEHPAP